jgi:hypothetical protein
MMNPSSLEIVAGSCFFGALVHAFSAQKIEAAAGRAKNETLKGLLHFAGEIEVVFGIWAAIFTLYCIFTLGFTPTLDSLQQKSFEEPIFVFVIMVIAATRPIIDTARAIILFFSKALHKVLRLPSLTTTYAITLALTPLLGSFITEPAAMTVAALLLKSLILDHSESDQPGGKKLLYTTVAALFVNISIGGTLTSFAAPPVLMVARIWNWDTAFMLSHFGWKSSVAVLLNTVVCVIINLKILKEIGTSQNENPIAPEKSSPLWIQIAHLLFLLLAILAAHYPVFLVASFLFFMGFTQATQFAQNQLKIREALLVSFFLGGLVVLTAEQGWWLKPILNSLSDFSLYLGAAGLTAITDNAAITSLAAQVTDLSITSKYAVLEGAVVGGGLTLIANAPNPAGYAILRDRFSDGGIEPLTFFFYALIPTFIAGVCLWIL